MRCPDLPDPSRKDMALFVGTVRDARPGSAEETDYEQLELDYFLARAKDHGLRIPDKLPEGGLDRELTPQEEKILYEIGKEYVLELYADLLSEADVTAIQELSMGEAFPPIIGRRRVRFDVHESFMGVPDASDRDFELITGLGGGDCGYPFQVGETYFVRASPDFDEKLWTTSICMDTHPIHLAKQHVRALRSWRAGLPLPPRIYGYLNDADQWDKERGLGGVRLILRGNGREHETRTNDNGTFLFDDLARGKYRIEILLPDYVFTEHSHSHEDIYLVNHNCAKLRLSMMKSNE